MPETDEMTQRVRTFFGFDDITVHDVISLLDSLRECVSPLLVLGVVSAIDAARTKVAIDIAKDVVRAGELANLDDVFDVAGATQFRRFHPEHRYDVVVDNVPCVLSFVPEQDGFGLRLMPCYEIPVDFVRERMSFPGRWFQKLLRAVENDGTVVAESHGAFSLHVECDRYKRQQKIKAFQNELEELTCQIEDMKPVYGEVISDLARTARVLKLSLDNKMGAANFADYAVRLNNLRRDTLALQKKHPDVARRQYAIDRMIMGVRNGNRTAAKQINQWAVRVGNPDIVPFVDEVWLDAFYERRLAAYASLEEVRGADLTLNPEEYADEEIIRELAAEGIITLAPDTISVSTKRGEKSYPVQYGQEIRVGDEVQLVGVVTMPLSVYKEVRGEYGKPSGLPELPHGLKLHLRLTVQDQVVVQGMPDDRLNKRIKQYEGGKKRGAALGLDPWASREATAPPPWAAGQAARARWR